MYQPLFHVVQRFTAVILLLSLFPSGSLRAETLPSAAVLVKQATQASVQRRYRQASGLLMQARRLAEESADYEQLFWVYTNIGINHAELLNYGEALQAFTTAYQIADAHLDARHVLSIRSNIAGLYMMNHEKDKALAEYEHIYKSITSPADRTFKGGCALNIATLLIDKRRFKEAETYLSTAETVLGADTANKVSLVTVRVNYLLGLGKNAAAYRLLQKVRASAPALNHIADLLLLQARAAVALNSYGEAAHLAQSALVGQNDLTMKKAVFEILAQCYSQQTNYPLAIAYKDSLLRVANELSNVTRQKLFESRQVQFDIWQKQHELDSYKTRQRLEWAFMALGVVAFLLLVWAFVQQRRAARQQRRLAAIELERRQERLDTMRRQFEAEQLLMQNEKQANERAIEQRSRELMSKALQTAKHNDALRQVINALESSETVAHSKEIAVKRSISALRHQLSASAEWKDFTTYFEQSNELFLSQLKRRHPSLTANEVRYLSLVYINLSPKEIALLLNITPEYCKKKKQQVARKMGLTSPHHLFAYLTSLA